MRKIVATVALVLVGISGCTTAPDDTTPPPIVEQTTVATPTPEAVEQVPAPDTQSMETEYLIIAHAGLKDAGYDPATFIDQELIALGYETCDAYRDHGAAHSVTFLMDNAYATDVAEGSARLSELMFTQTIAMSSVKLCPQYQNEVIEAGLAWYDNNL